MFDFLISSAVAQEAAAPAAQAAGEATKQLSPITQFLPFIIIFIIFYFLMIRPQKKKMTQEQSMLNQLGKGDEIYTKSGILGKIVGLTEKVATIEVSEGTKIKILRAQIGGKSAPLFETKKEDKK